MTSRTFAYTRGSDTDRMTLSYAYDVRGRMTTETATLDPSSGTSSSATLTHSYDALGRLSGTTAEVQGGIQVVTEQDYTLQGWLESLEVSADGAALFFQSLGYDGEDVLSGTVPLHTGIVTRKDEAWTSGGGAAATRTEGYAYDHAGRLAKEVLSEDIISYSYDYRGNILSVTGGTSPSTYAYDGYRLTSAQVPQTASFTHDALGRMTYDGLTGQSTAYNDLDLVRNISRNGTTLANYSYLSDGTKLEAVDGSGGGLVYRGPFVYRKNPGGSSLTLESVAFGGGRLAAGKVLLHVRDYLGSVRAVIDGSTGTIYKASDYSAFGNESSVSSVETSAVPSGMTLREAYTGKEDQTPDFGTSYTDFGARQYSPTLRRWMIPDPMSEKYYGISPYAFCNNNPVNFVDPDGKFPDIIWDIASVGFGVHSLVGNIQSGNVRGAIGDGIGIVVDVAAAALPFIPGGVGAARAGAKVVNAADDVTDAAKAAECSVSNAFIETTIDVLPENQISRELLDKPNKRGNAFVFKKDGTAVEIHHVRQSADGPYLEMHRSDHRGKGNYKENHPNADASTQIDRKEFNKQRRYYWQKEYDKYYK